MLSGWPSPLRSTASTGSASPCGADNDSILRLTGTRTRSRGGPSRVCLTGWVRLSLDVAQAGDAAAAAAASPRARLGAEAQRLLRQPGLGRLGEHGEVHRLVGGEAP